MRLNLLSLIVFQCLLFHIQVEANVEPDPKESLVAITDAVPSGGRILRYKKGKAVNESQVESGVWQVLNKAAKLEGHKHPPSCILIRLKATIVIPVRDEEGKITNRTIPIPKNATVKGMCGETEQWVTLIWNNSLESGRLVKTGELTLLFKKQETDAAIYLTDVWSSVYFFLEDSGESIISRHVPTQEIIMSIKDAKLWYTPFRFSYVCHHRTEIKLNAETLPVRSSSNSMIVDPINNEEAYLVLHDIRVEAFRSHRFGNHFTHLSYDCFNKWAYSYMPGLIGSSLALLVFITSVAFVFRRRLGCDPGDQLEQEESDDDTRNS